MVDVHGMTVLEAVDVLMDLLKNPGVYRVITGKGNHSAGGVSIIQLEYKRILAARAISWTYAKISDGGTGAIELEIR